MTPQQSEGQHAPNIRSARPKLMGERIDKNKGRAYQPLQRHQDNHKKGLHIRPREQESGGEDPQAKVLKPCRVTRPRETETEVDRPPSKVLKPCRVPRPREAETEGDKPPSKVLKQCRITRPRDVETEVDKPPAKVLKPCRVTRPREGETEGDKPPSKVRKSMQWVKSFFTRAPPMQGVSSGQAEETETPTGNDGENASTKMETDPSQGPEQESPAVQPPPTPMEED